MLYSIDTGKNRESEKRVKTREKVLAPNHTQST
jgi:hypothetical protein